MTARHFKYSKGVTLVEVMVAMVILTVAALGALGYQYLAATHARIAKAQITATRTAQLLLEDWKSTGGSTDYDPSTLGLGFSSALAIPGHWSAGGGGGMGSPLHDAVHAITVDGIPMLVMLTWADVDYDSIAEVTLRQLAVIVEFGEGSNISPVILTTYVRLDAGGG